MKEWYYLVSEFRGYTPGTPIRVHDWNDVEVEVSLHGTLEWIPKRVFKIFFTDNPNRIQNRIDSYGMRAYL